MLVTNIFSFFHDVLRGIFLRVIYLFTTQSRLLTALEKKAFENIVGKGENAGVTSIFSFFHNVFYSSQRKFQFLTHNYFVVCKCSEFGLV